MCVVVQEKAMVVMGEGGGGCLPKELPVSMDINGGMPFT